VVEEVVVEGVGVTRTSYFLYPVPVLHRQCYTMLLYLYIPAFESGLVDKKFHHIGTVVIYI